MDRSEEERSALKMKCEGQGADIVALSFKVNTLERERSELQAKVNNLERSVQEFMSMLLSVLGR